MPLFPSSLRPSSTTVAAAVASLPRNHGTITRRTPRSLIVTSLSYHPELIRTITTTTIKPGKMSETAKREAEIKRNPHPDFKSVEGSRPDWDRSQGFNYKKTAEPSWAFGDGANSLDSAQPQQHKHISIDPYEAGRPAPFNYKLLISAVVPRPIGFVSTRSGTTTTTSEEGKEEKETFNLAPFSYFNIINHDPPLFVLGIASPLESAKAKDTLRNLAATGECVVSIISEHFVEAANATSVDAPAGVSEWAVAGLTPSFDCVDAPRVPRPREAVFSVECRLESAPREFESRATPGKKTGCLVVLEGTRFWVRADALNEDRNLVAPEVLRPVGRLGGITYARVTEALELPRPSFERDVGGVEGYEKLKFKLKGESKSKKE